MNNPDDDSGGGPSTHEPESVQETEGLQITLEVRLYDQTICILICNPE